MENGNLTIKCPKLVKSYIEEQKTRMYPTKGDYNDEDWDWQQLTLMTWEDISRW